MVAARVDGLGSLGASQIPSFWGVAVAYGTIAACIAGMGGATVGLALVEVPVSVVGLALVFGIGTAGRSPS